MLLLNLIKRKKLNSITIAILVLYVLSYTAIIILHLNGTVSENFLISSIYAGLLNLINSILAIIFFNRSYRSGSQKFMIYNLGGMGIRLMLLLFAFVIVIKFLNIDNYAFILVFFLFYFISLIFEVLFYLKKSKN